MPGRDQRLRRDHPCCAAFLDETGAISRDRFFAVGLVKCAEPARVLRRLQKLRDQTHWYNEIKFSDVTSNAVPLYKRFVDACLAPGDVEFFCFVADRDAADPIERFGSSWDAYSKLAEQLVVAALHADQLMSLMADNYSTPDVVLFEEELKMRVNRRVNRLALVSVCRLDSKSSLGLQAVDLMTSAVAHEFRAAAGLASPTTPKAQVAAYVRQALGTPSCLSGWRNGQHSVAVYEHGSWTPGSRS